MPQRNFVTHPLVLRELTVARLIDVTPRMRRVTLTGDQLRAFSNAGFDLPAFVSDGFDDHVKLVFSETGDATEALPVQRAHSIDWLENTVTLTRDYTPRRFDPVLGELDLDFVRYGDGPAATWAEGASIGDVLHMVGPKSSVVLPADIDWIVLAGDETALPAIGRYLDEYRTNIPVIVVVKINDRSAVQDLSLRDGDELHWVVCPSVTTTELSDAVTGLSLPSGVGYVWAAAESRSLLPLRRWCIRERGMAKSHVNITGYWHLAADPGTSAADQVGLPIPAAVDLQALLSPVPWFVVRAALSTGLLDAIATRPRPRAELAAHLGLHVDGVNVLVQSLESMDAAVVKDDVVALEWAGELLLADEHLREGLEDTLESALLLSLAQLDASLRTGRPAHVLAHGATPSARGADDPARAQEAVESAIGFDFVARGITDLPTLRNASSVAVTGCGAVAFSAALSGITQVTVVGSLVELAAARQAQPTIDFIAAEGFDSVDAEVAAAALAFAHRTDAEVVALLVTLAEVAKRAVVVELLKPPTSMPSPHDAEHALLAYAATGVAPRGLNDFLRLAAEAGWSLVASSPLGWDHEAIELQRDC